MNTSTHREGRDSKRQAAVQSRVRLRQRRSSQVQQLSNARPKTPLIWLQMFNKTGKKKSIHQKVTCKLNIETWTGVLQYEQGCWQADLGFKLLTLQPHSVTESTTQPTWQVRVERTRKCMRVKCWITRLPHYRKDYWLRVCWCEWCGPIQCSGGPDHTLILKLGAAVWNLKHEEIKE